MHDDHGCDREGCLHYAVPIPEIGRITLLRDIDRWTIYTCNDNADVKNWLFCYSHQFFKSKAMKLWAPSIETSRKS